MIFIPFKFNFNFKLKFNLKLRLKHCKIFYEGNTITFIDNPEKEMPKGNSCYYDDDCIININNNYGSLKAIFILI